MDYNDLQTGSPMPPGDEVFDKNFFDENEIDFKAYGSSGLTPNGKMSGSSVDASGYVPLSAAPHLHQQQRNQYNQNSYSGGYTQSSTYQHPNQYYKQQNTPQQSSYYDNSGYGASSYTRAPSIGDTVRDTIDIELNKTLQQITGCINLIQKLRPDLLSREKPNDLIMCRYHLMQFMQKVDRMYETDASSYKPAPSQQSGNYYGSGGPGGAPANNAGSNNSNNNAQKMNSYPAQQSRGPAQQQQQGYYNNVASDMDKQQQHQQGPRGPRSAPAPVNTAQVQAPPIRTSNPRTMPPSPDDMQMHEVNARRDYTSGSSSSDDPMLPTSRSNSTFVDLETFLDGGIPTTPQSAQIQMAMNLDGSPPGQIMQPFRAVPSPGQYEVRKNVNSDESEWNFAEDVGTFEEGEYTNRVPDNSMSSGVAMYGTPQNMQQLQSLGYKSGSKRNAEEFEGPYGASNAYPNKKLRASSDFIIPQQINYEATGPSLVYLPQTPNAYTDPKMTKQLIKSNISVFKVNPLKPRNISEVASQAPNDPIGENSKPNGKVPSTLQNTLASTMMYQFNLKKETRKQQQLKKNRKRRSTIASGPPPTANLSLADFDFLQVLGTGTFGRVRLCMYKATRQYYCMKILRKQTIYRYKQMEHIKNEKNILKDLKHQGIVQLFSTFNDEQNLYLLMEYVPGGELFLYIRKYGKLDERTVKFFAAELVLILEHLHEMSIVYRDLKPENILLDERGHIKLTDFGFSKVVTDRTWTMCGTPDYLAPEVISGRGHNAAVDWWSLGVLIFEMLAGYPPFTDNSTLVLFEKIRNADSLPLPQHFSRSAQDLIRKLLTIDPSRRLGSSIHGALDIKLHEWFADISWTEIEMRDMLGPIVPKIDGAGDTKNFQAAEAEEEQQTQQPEVPLPPDVQKFFADF
eukprot:TRINITY_DN2973_c0_g1_i1.p1 TRINITY_DN2973_c0_g1~~TRINITY_DN2973_c0_g1_i1.p1  ORF type:complete len:908 (-),score=191.34 TRINITY_DN2973_c0_g1_i1:53-2776(-)